MVEGPHVTPELPIFAARASLLEALARGPVVLSSPTGSGKSTEVPRWCPGRTLVVEPRRIACRTLSGRVAELEQTPLGAGVGYVVRDERVSSASTRILFATPGLVLRDRTLLAHADTVVLDEFHERSLELDLLLALLQRQQRRGLIVMSATLDGDRLASHLGATHVSAGGRVFPVEIRYLPGTETLPSASDLATRVRAAVAEAANDAGDVLVFLPGKAEIEACAQALRDGHYKLLPLHGGLSLEQQRRVFEPASQRKLILATNVAETSLTIPGVGVVIDAGLVRQMRYQAGRGSLSLVAVAADSAAQRTGRAGRTAAGVCYRLWRPDAKLEKNTLPEIHRESLVPLLLAAAAWDVQPEQLPFLDPPKPYALAAARVDLAAWGALAADGSLSASGRDLFTQPVAPLHARLLLSAKEHGCLEDMLDLVAVLSVNRPLFLPGALAQHGTPDPELCCDVSLLVQTLRGLGPVPEGVSSHALAEAKAARTRLRRLHGLDPDAPHAAALDRAALIHAALAADPRVAHVARVRGRELFFSNGGTEIELARESALCHLSKLEAVVVLDTRAFGSGREARVLVTCGTATSLAVLARAGLGTERIASVRLEQRRVVCGLERVYANRVIAEREATPSGPLLREALVSLLERGSLFREAVAETRVRLARAALAEGLAARAQAGSGPTPGAPALDSWLASRLERLGVEAPEDLDLLSAGDFLAPELPEETRARLDRDYPQTLNVGDAVYRADYDLAQQQVVLQLIKGTRREPPPLAYLPRLGGLRVCVAGPRGTVILRKRGSAV
jgi:ATP-dependent helicase HrpB